MEPGALGAIFSKPPALHRFPVSNSEHVQQLCRLIVQDYQDEPARIWGTAESQP